MHQALRQQQVQPIVLPHPRESGGKPLMQALKDRKTTRHLRPDPLSPEILADLLWAANGYNRPAIGHRTAPSARNWQEIDIYLAMENGLFLFDPLANLLLTITNEDIRGLTGQQEFAATAPLNLIYVSDFTRMREAFDREQQKFYATVDTGFICQNVYLYCASEGLGTVVRSLFSRRDLAKHMCLRQTQRVVLVQSVGYPARAPEEASEPL
jgi:nitroreductase